MIITSGVVVSYVVLFMLWLLFGIFSAVIASSKERSALGWFMAGFFLGPFGLLVAALPKIDPAANALGDFAAELGQPATLESALAVTPMPSEVGPSDDETKTCPFCAETIKSRAFVCRYCNRDLPMVRSAEQSAPAKLFSAAMNGDVDGVRSCVEAGSDVDVRNSFGATPLFIAAVQGNRVLVALLIQMGADPTIPNNVGKLPSAAAAEQGFGTVAELLKAPTPSPSSRSDPL